MVKKLTADRDNQYANVMDSSRRTSCSYTDPIVRMREKTSEVSSKVLQRRKRTEEQIFRIYNRESANLCGLSVDRDRALPRPRDV